MKTATKTAGVKQVENALRALGEGFLNELRARIAEKVAAAVKAQGKTAPSLRLVHSTHPMPRPSTAQHNKQITLPDKSKVNANKARHGWRRCFFTKTGKNKKGISHLWNVETEALALIPRGVGKVKHEPCHWHGGKATVTAVKGKK